MVIVIRNKMNKEIKDIETKYQRKLTVDEELILADWLHDIAVKNEHPIGKHLSLHDWEAGMKEAKREFKKENK
jgi:hypothetical protein